MIEVLWEFIKLHPVIAIILLTFMPFLELRASIPYGIFNTDLNWVVVALIAIITNVIVAVFVYLFVNYILHLFLKIKYIEKVYHRIVERTQKKVHPYVEKYGVIGLAIFTGIPLPGSGVYTGGLGAYLLGFDFKDYMLASAIGVIIAGIVVTIISITGSEVFSFLIKVI